MDKIVWAIIAIIVAIIVFHLLSKRTTSRCGGSVTGTPCGPCSTGTATGPCFPGSEFHVKGGLFDLRPCNDDVYLITTDRNKVHFLTE